NGSLSAEDRQSIAAELSEREDELLSLMNTRNARGEYLFSGFQGKTQPFVRGADGGYSYQGDEGQRKLQIASSLSIPISDSGKSIFQNVTNAGRYQVVPGSPLNISAPLVQDEVAIAGSEPFPPAGIGIHFTSDTDYIVYDLADPPTDFSDPDAIPLDQVLHRGVVDGDEDTADELVFRGVMIKFDG